jgi:hypothetical protein
MRTGAVAVALLGAGAPAASAALPNTAAYANCYRDGTIATTLWMDKIGLGGQWLGWNLHYYDRRQGRYTFTTGWHTFWSGYGQLGSPAKISRQIDPGHYSIYVEYGWNLGSGWSTAGGWVASYVTAGDGPFGVPEGFCRAAPILQTVTGCSDFGLATLACASRTQRVKRRSVPKPPARTRPAR